MIIYPFFTFNFIASLFPLFLLSSLANGVGNHYIYAHEVNVRLLYCFHLWGRLWWTRHSCLPWRKVLLRKQEPRPPHHPILQGQRRNMRLLRRVRRVGDREVQGRPINTCASTPASLLDQIKTESSSLSLEQFCALDNYKYSPIEIVILSCVTA